ncbi:MAG: ABC transporter ATP-binding protein [Thermodesulfobacteriota bacterium]
MNPVLEVEGLHVRIPWRGGVLHPVQDVGFSVRPGETLCLVGESGCGKSLSALAIMGLLPRRALRTVGKLSMDGEDLSSATERRMSEIRGNRMSMIFQEPMTCLNPCYTVGDQLMEVLRRHKKVSKLEARQRALKLLEHVGIPAGEHRLRQYPHQLSGGLRQRVMIAMALMCEPRLLIADEPTTALDVTIQAQILGLLKRLQEEFHLSLVLITHDLGVVARMAHRVAVMYAGQIVESGSTSEIFSKPLHPYTKALMDCIPVPGRTMPGQRLGAIPGVVPTLLGDADRCYFSNRCESVHRECLEGAVELRELEAQRTVRCLLYPAP